MIALMRRRVLVLALILIVAPLSWSAVLVVYGAPLLELGWRYVEVIGKAQIAALLILSPIIAATKLYEWAQAKGFI